MDKITGALKADPMSVLPELSPIVFPVLYIKPFSLLNLEQPSVRMPAALCSDALTELAPLESLRCLFCLIRNYYPP